MITAAASSRAESAAGDFQQGGVMRGGLSGKSHAFCRGANDHGSRKLAG
jgi:hypothetical protein